ncbi:hypothetical protein Tco_0213926 [Tanacetum coccineum]
MILESVGNVHLSVLLKLRKIVSFNEIERNSDTACFGLESIEVDPLFLLYQTHQNSYQNSQFQPQVSLYQSLQYGSPYQSQQYSNNQSSTPLSITYPSNDYQSSVHHNVYSPPSSIPQLEYAPTVNQQQQQPEFPQLDSGLTVLVFKQGDDPIDAINHMMSFLSAVVTSRYPTTNNQLRNSSNPRQQATINDGRVTLQPVQGRQISFATGTSRTYTPGASGSNSGKQRTVICYNCKGEGHIPTGQTFAIVGNACPLTRITTTAEVPLRKPTALESDTPKNDHVAKILGYGKYLIWNVKILRVYYVEGLGHNLFYVRKFRDSNLEVAFHQPICFIHNLEGVGLLTAPFLKEKKGVRFNALYLQKKRNLLDLLFQLLFDELINPSSSVDRPTPEVIAPIAEVVALEHAASTGSPSSTTVDQDAPSPSNSQTTPKTQSPKNNSEASSSLDVIPTIVHTTAPNLEHITKWTKDHPLDNIIRSYMASEVTERLVPQTTTP